MKGKPTITQRAKRCKIMERFERIMDVLKEMDDSELVSVWNEYCYTTNRYDDEILDADRLEEWVNNSGDTMNILNRFYFGYDDYDKNGSANPNRDYFTFNGYGNIISFDYIYNSYTNEFNYIDVDDLVDYIIENEEAFYNDDIQDILDDADDDEE